MKMKRHLGFAAGALSLVVAGATVTLVGGASSSQAAETPSSAYGLELTAAGNSVVPKTPAVTSTDGKPVSDSVVALPDNPIASGGVITANAQNDAASAAVTDLGVGDGLLAQLPSALTDQLGSVCDQVSTALQPVTGPVNDALGSLTGQLDGLLGQVADATSGSGLDLSLLGSLDITKLTAVQLDGLCNVLSGDAKLVGAGTVEASCNGHTGTANVADLTALGLPVDIDFSQPNSKVSIPGLLTITGNRQTENADGTFTVDALVVNLLDQINLTVSSATCGHVTSRQPPTEPPNPAPTPTPIHTQAPVTG